MLLFSCAHFLSDLVETFFGPCSVILYFFLGYSTGGGDVPMHLCVSSNFQFPFWRWTKFPVDLSQYSHVRCVLWCYLSDFSRMCRSSTPWRMFSAVLFPLLLLSLARWLWSFLLFPWGSRTPTTKLPMDITFQTKCYHLYLKACLHFHLVNFHFPNSLNFILKNSLSTHMIFSTSVLLSLRFKQSLAFHYFQVPSFPNVYELVIPPPFSLMYLETASLCTSVWPCICCEKFSLAPCCWIPALQCPA